MMNGINSEPMSPDPANKSIERAEISFAEARVAMIAPSVAIRLSAIDGRIIEEVILISPVV